MNLDFTLVTPATIEELEQYMPDLQFLGSFMPLPNFEQVVKRFVPCLNLIYEQHTGLILAAYSLQLWKHSAELHGVVRQDAKFIFPNGHLITPTITKFIFEEVFERFGKECLITKVAKQFKGGRGFCILNGFKKINTERGAGVYRLTRAEYLARKHKNEQSSHATSNSHTSAVCV